jgi:hypothetical protein
MMLAPPIRLIAAALLATQALLPATPQQAPEKAANPVSLVSRAEKLIKEDHKEDAEILLWQALELLRGKASNPIEEATVLSARYLLKENDPLEMERRAAYTAVATAQTDLAKSYRIKKWYDTAQTRLDVAAQFDPEVITKESTILAAKRKKMARPKKAAAVPKQSAAKVSPLLRKNSTRYTHGPWAETEDGIRISAKGFKTHCQWICDADHKDNEIIVEVRPEDPKQSWDATIAVGQYKLTDASYYSGYRCAVQYYAEHKRLQLSIVSVIEGVVKDYVTNDVACNAPRDGYHLLAVRIDSGRLQLQINGEPAVTADVPSPTAGAAGIMHGLAGTASCPINFRNFQIRPLPKDVPSDEELREAAANDRQHEITTAVEEAKQLLTAKMPEPAAQRLRDAIALLPELPEGILRTNMLKSIKTMLKKADKITKKRERAALACAKTFADLADKYALDKRPRLALALTQQAARFDAEGQATRLAAVENAVAEWNVEQLTLHAAELAPPKNDGKQLREWFGKNRLLDSRASNWIVAGASARTDQGGGRPTVLMPLKRTMMAGTVDVHIRLPAVDCQGGFAFDAAGPHDYTIVMLSRSKTKLGVTIARWAGGKWIYLDKKMIPIDPWRMEGWHHLTLETAATGIKVKVREIELKVDRRKLGNANGRIGLYAAGSDGSLTIEFRGFQAKPK